MNKPKLNMIVCVAENNLIGDKNPTGNGLLWHVPEELKLFKELTIGDILIVGENTAKFMPIDKIRKNREVIVLKSGCDMNEIMSYCKSKNKIVWICGGCSTYKYFLDNYEIDEIFVSRLQPHVKVAHASHPLYFPDIEAYGYKLYSISDASEHFQLYIYK